MDHKLKLFWAQLNLRQNTVHMLGPTYETTGMPGSLNHFKFEQSSYQLLCHTVLQFPRCSQ